MPAGTPLQVGRPPGGDGRPAAAAGARVQVRVGALEVGVLGAVDLGLVLDGIGLAAGKAGFK